MHTDSRKPGISGSKIMTPLGAQIILRSVLGFEADIAQIGIVEVIECRHTKNILIERTQV